MLVEFTSKAGVIQEKNYKKGPDSLTAKVDNATTNHYAKETGTSDVQKATEQLSNVLPIKRNVAITDQIKILIVQRTDASVPNSRESEEQDNCDQKGLLID